LLVIDPKMMCSASSSVESKSPKHNLLSLNIQKFSFNEEIALKEQL